MNLSRQWIVRLVLVAVMVSSCGDRDGGNPEVYLVEDGDNSYHLQWTETLEEERIVLIETTSASAKLFSSAVVVERERQLLIFPAGVIRSRGGGAIQRAELSVEILPGEERFNVDLPQKAFHAMEAGDKQLPYRTPIRALQCHWTVQVDF